jgi:hypothetical protein
VPESVLDRRTAWVTIVVSTSWRFRVELTAWLTRARAWSSSTERASSWVRARSSWKSRTFSMAIPAWSAKVLSRSISLGVTGSGWERETASPPIGAPWRNSGTATMARVAVARAMPSWRYSGSASTSVM